MRVPLRLSDIEQEHLQELYNAAGIARDQLPYTPEFDRLCTDFHDRTFKNADREQVYDAMLRYVRSSTCKAQELPGPEIDAGQAESLKAVMRRHATKGRILPYSAEFEAALREFNSLSGTALSERDFWMALAGGGSRRPSRRPKPAAATQPAATKAAED